VLVCGDETQKPFPLLVWNLASRKLLYDLRIPHHDFVTSLAAITHEGHYVCCVAKVSVQSYTIFNILYRYHTNTTTSVLCSRLMRPVIDVRMKWI
jgi:hypothetical protein